MLRRAWWCSSHTGLRVDRILRWCGRSPYHALLMSSLFAQLINHALAQDNQGLDAQQAWRTIAPRLAYPATLFADIRACPAAHRSSQRPTASCGRVDDRPAYRRQPCAARAAAMAIKPVPHGRPILESTTSTPQPMSACSAPERARIGQCRLAPRTHETETMPSAPSAIDSYKSLNSPAGTLARVVGKLGTARTRGR